MTHFNSSLKMMGTTYCLQKELVKIEMNRDEVFEDSWMNEKR